MHDDTPPGSLGRTHEDLPGLPRGRSSLPADAVGSAQRDRLVRAMIAACAERGWHAVGIADLVGRARVSRKAFYTHFADKEACFLAAAGVGTEMMFARVRAAARAVPGGAGPVTRLRAGIRGYLAFLADEPEFARVLLVDTPAAGPRALDLFTAVHRRFGEVIGRWYAMARQENPHWPAAPAEACTAAVGAVHELVVTRVRARETAALPALEDALVRIPVVLLTGWHAGGRPD
jgi:AcrR family transcriptional regulator